MVVFFVKKTKVFLILFLFTTLILSTKSDAKEIEHKRISVNGISMHVAEIGEGPIVLFLHGFPELWYTWRHQMSYMAAHGYRAVVPDLRGYGDTTGAPIDDPSKFTTFHVVGDIVALLDTIAKQEKVIIVGHDWGALIAWSFCLYRPDKVKALINLSVVFTPRNPNNKPLETLHAVYGDDYYISRFQKAGEIEGVFAKAGTRKVLEKFLNYRDPGPLLLPRNKEFEDLNKTISLPSWLLEEDFEYYATKYENTGFTGGLNYYRSLDLNWETTAPWNAAQVKVPVKFIVGDLDLTYNSLGTKDYIHNGGLQKYVPLLEEVVVLKGVAHFIHEEKPDEINKHVYDFVTKFSPPFSLCRAY